MSLATASNSAKLDGSSGFSNNFNIGPSYSIRDGYWTWRNAGLRCALCQSIIPVISVGWSLLTKMLWEYKSLCHNIEAVYASSLGAIMGRIRL